MRKALRNLEGFQLLKFVEARVGIEPTHKGFADLSLTTWVPRPGGPSSALVNCRRSVPQAGHIWSGRPGSNRRHLPWQGSTLPLSYSRSSKIKYNGQVLCGQRGLACCCNGFLRFQSEFIEREKWKLASYRWTRARFV